MPPLQHIFFHVGTGKTGTTFLQYHVFPHLKGIYYIQRTRYRKARQIIAKTGHGRILLSREFDQQLEREVSRFAKAYPDTVPIIVFRRHDSYIASQYRRFVKNGYRGTFREFFDVEGDQGFFKKADLDYMRQIGILKAHFSRGPIVMIYEDMRAKPEAFIRAMAAAMGAEPDFKRINLSPKHSSYSPKQLKAIQAMGRYINLRKRRPFRNSMAHLFFRLWLNGIRYSTLFIGKLLPASWLRPGPLIAPKELDEVKDACAADWQACQEVALRPE